MSPPTAAGLGPHRSTDEADESIGRAFVDAIVAGDFDGLEGLLSATVRFRAIVPRTIREASAAADARAVVEDWFGDTAHRELVSSSIDHVADRLALSYRLVFLQDGQAKVAEQHAVAIVADGRIADLGVICSGFRPLPAAPDGGEGVAQPVTATRADSRLDAVGLSCATLTPAIRAGVMALEPGQVLEILTDDPSAEDGLRSWTRLTGHELLDTAAATGDSPAGSSTAAEARTGDRAPTAFYVRRAARRAVAQS